MFKDPCNLGIKTTYLNTSNTVMGMIHNRPFALTYHIRIMHLWLVGTVGIIFYFACSIDNERNNRLVILVSNHAYKSVLTFNKQNKLVIVDDSYYLTDFDNEFLKTEAKVSGREY